MKRVVISGTGCISCHGIGVESFFEGLKENINSLERYSSPEIWDGFVAKVKAKVPESSINKYSRTSQFLKYAITEALTQSSISFSHFENIPLIIGTTKGSLEHFLDYIKNNDQNENIFLDGILNEIFENINFSDESYVVSNACASGTIAAGEGYRRIKYFDDKRVICSGADSLTDFIVAGFASLKALDKNGAKPFDKIRTGLTPGEAGGAIILENLSACLDRGATPLAEVAGYSSSNDANHITGPSRDGSGLIQVIKNALHEAGLKPNDIDFINLHGTGTVYNDAMESTAIKTVFGNNVLCNSIKGSVGHTMGAAGILECIYLTKVLEENIITPTTGFNIIDDNIPINIVSKLTEKNVNYVLSTSSGFGGVNAAIILKRISNE